LDHLKKLGSNGEKLQGNSLVGDPAPQVLSQLLREIAGNPNFLHICGVDPAGCLAHWAAILGVLTNLSLYFYFIPQGLSLLHELGQRESLCAALSAPSA
jgi:hypothetical protein